MHRLMLLSNTYQQSTQTNALNVKADPTNQTIVAHEPYPFGRRKACATAS